MASGGQKPVRILVADDARSMRSLIRSAFPFGRRPMEFHDADNGLDALAMYRDRRFDIVILDINMPDLDGLSVLEQLRAYDEDCLVFVVTGDSDPDLATQAISLGARDLFRKPISQQIGLRILHTFDIGRRPAAVLVIDETDVAPVTLKFGLDALRISHRMYRAESVPEALRTLDRVYFDVVFVGIDFNGPKGIGLLAQLKRLHPHVYTVMFTDQCTAELVKLAAANGADDYLLKSIALEHLQRMWDRYRRQR
jgi:DNA-binding NtrC family response regulator